MTLSKEFLAYAHNKSKRNIKIRINVVSLQFQYNQLINRYRYQLFDTRLGLINDNSVVNVDKD